MKDMALSSSIERKKESEGNGLIKCCKRETFDALR